MYFKREAEFKPGTFFAGGGERRIPEDQQWGAIRALEPTTGKMAWEFRLVSPPWAGVMSTASGLVFAGSSGNFMAIDSKTGKSLWRYQMGAPLYTAAVTYMLDGRQYVLMGAGTSITAFALPQGN